MKALPILLAALLLWSAIWRSGPEDYAARQEEGEGSMFRRPSFHYTLAVYDSDDAALSYLEFDT